MGKVRFYLACARRTPKAIWALMGILSTLATYILPLVVLATGLADSAVLAFFLLWVSPLLLLLCILVTPFLQAYKLYSEKEQQLQAVEQASQREQRLLQSRIQELEQRRSAEDNVRRQHVQDFINQFEEKKRRAAAGEAIPCPELYTLEIQATRYLENNFPTQKELSTSISLKAAWSMGQTFTPEEAVQRCDERLQQLRQVLEALE